MSDAGRAGAAVDLWRQLRGTPGVAELAFPCAVAGAERLREHASMRRFYRLTAADLEPPARAPETLVLVVYENDDVEAVARYERSALWFQAAGVKVPRIYARTSRALLVEDGGDELLAEAALSDRALDRRYAEAAGVILSLQSHGQSVEGPNRDWSLNEQRLRRELEFTEQHAVRGWLEAGPSSVRAEAFDRLAALVAQLPRRVCHRDFHSRNLLVNEDLMVVDFQDAMSGPIFYDLVSLLGDDYRDVPASARAAALDAFWSAAQTQVRSSSAAAVPAEPGILAPGPRQGYALTAAQRSLKALGTFGYQVSVVGRHGYARYARRTWRHARRALSSLGWHDLIEQLVVFDRL